MCCSEIRFGCSSCWVFVPCSYWRCQQPREQPLPVPLGSGLASDGILSQLLLRSYVQLPMRFANYVDRFVVHPTD